MDEHDFEPGPRIVEITYAEDRFRLPAHRLAAAIQEESRIAPRPQPRPRRRDTGSRFVALTITTILLAMIVVLGAVVVLLVRH